MLPNLLDDLMRAWDSRAADDIESAAPPQSEAAGPAQAEQPADAIHALLSNLLQNHDASAPPAPALAEPVPAQRPADTVVQIEAKYLSVTLARRQYAIPVEAVVEAGRFPATTFVPGLPRYVLGVFALRGDVVPVIDTRILSGDPEPSPQPSALRIVTIQNTEASARAAFVFDSLDGIVTLRSEPCASAGPEHPLAAVLAGMSAPAGATAMRSAYGLLDVDRLLWETGCLADVEAGTPQ